MDPVQDEFRIKEATDRTLRWIDRCISAHRKPETQNLFGIVQGHLDTKPGGLREYSLKDWGVSAGERPDTCEYIAWQISVGILLFSEWRAEGTVQSYTVYIYINIDI